MACPATALAEVVDYRPSGERSSRQRRAAHASLARSGGIPMACAMQLRCVALVPVERHRNISAANNIPNNERAATRCDSRVCKVHAAARQPTWLFYACRMWPRGRTTQTCLRRCRREEERGECRPIISPGHRTCSERDDDHAAGDAGKEAEVKMSRGLRRIGTQIANATDTMQPGPAQHRRKDSESSMRHYFNCTNARQQIGRPLRCFELPSGPVEGAS